MGVRMPGAQYPLPEISQYHVRFFCGFGFFFLLFFGFCLILALFRYRSFFGTPTVGLFEVYDKPSFIIRQSHGISFADGLGASLRPDRSSSSIAEAEQNVLARRI
jgi:hypothetical protein